MLNLGRLENVRLGCDGFPGANTLAYSLGATMMKKKVFYNADTCWDGPGTQGYKTF